MKPNNLFEFLSSTCCRYANKRIISYPKKSTGEGRSIPYSSLQQICEGKAASLFCAPGFRPGGIVLVHFTDHLDNILWFWAVLLSGCVPALSTPLPNNLEQRERHLEHLKSLFDNPICLTRRSIADEFGSCPSLNVQTVETLTSLSSDESQIQIADAQPNSLAVLMLTSGSTGNAKAVRLSHSQMLASVAGKAKVASFSDAHSLMNWVGIDHVAALMECHMLAMYLGLEQVHVQTSDIISEPIKFLEIITRHRVGRTFAPNFFLASLVRAINSHEPESLEKIDLSHLKLLVSGGEVNPVQTCVEVTQLLTRFGATESVLSPAFGMTETCAGCIYNTNCPDYDLQTGMDFASLGECIPGIEMRVVQHADNNDTTLSKWETPRGSLQVRGPIVTSGYYKDPVATTKAFSPDGWFDTGDEAIIDATGRLHIVGRVKDQVRINGIAIVPTEVENCLNASKIPGAELDYYSCFAFRPKNAQTETLVVLYLPRYGYSDFYKRVQTNRAIVKVVMHHSNVCPYVLPLDSKILQKSTLGKLSRGQLRNAFTQGKFSEFKEANDEAFALYNAQNGDEPKSAREAQLLEVFREAFLETMGIPENTFDVVTPLFDMGITSVQLVFLKRRIESVLGLAELPLLTLLINPTVRALASAIDLSTERAKTNIESVAKNSNAFYEPVVKMRSEGRGTPLWFFHPGVGEVLVFLNLARYLDDRPVYALRARGFEQGETFFKNIEEAVVTYYSAIKTTQPHGPYALAGYSFGAMLAFETAKRLEIDGAGQPQVKFLASFNLPPHIKFRMQQLDWLECALHLAYFLGLMTEAHARDLSQHVERSSREEVLDHILLVAAQGRLDELALSRNGLKHWINLAHSMQTMARDYEPQGSISSFDVFYCKPLAEVAKNETEWFEKHISRWETFCADNVRFHKVEGEHYTMIDAEHVGSFQKILRAAMNARGL